MLALFASFRVSELEVWLVEDRLRVVRILVRGEEAVVGWVRRVEGAVVGWELADLLPSSLSWERERRRGARMGELEEAEGPRRSNVKMPGEGRSEIIAWLLEGVGKGERRSEGGCGEWLGE